MDRTPPGVLARILRSEAGSLAALVRESLEALVGRPLHLETLQADHPDLGRLFAGRELFVFPFVDRDGRPLPMFLALDLPAAVATGAAFSLMSVEQARAALASGEPPESLQQAIGEVAGVVSGTAARLVRARAPGEKEALCRGRDLLRITPGAWPALVEEIDHRVPWDVLGLRLSIEGVGAGALLLGSSERWEGPAGAGTGEDADTAELPAEELEIADGGPTDTARAASPCVPDESAAPVAEIPRGIRVQVVGDPRDRATAALRAALADAGCRVLPVYDAAGTRAPASAIFVVSRSPLDLRARLGAACAGRRAGLVVACSDRPTIDLVRAARAGAADTFLVLPAERARLCGLFQRFVEVPLP